MDYAAQRRERVGRFVRDNQLDGFLVTNPINVTYLTGFTGDSSYLLAGKDTCLLVSDGRYEQQLREECPGVPVHIRPPSMRIMPATAGALGRWGWKAVGVEGVHLTVSDFQTLKDAVPAASWKICEDIVEALRVVKDPSELELIRKAVAIAERALQRFLKSIKGDDTEKALADRMEMLLRAEGARCSSFPTIVGVSERAALPHAPLTDKRVGDGELMLLDWGANGGLYMSDLTRVYGVNRISPKLEEVYGVVLKAQRRAIGRIRPGVKAQDVDAEARSALEEAGFGPFFSHGLGHGFGLQIHEAPGLRPQSDMVLQAGMVTTVEPGVYLPGWGGVRIEDDVVITPDGCEILTSANKEPIPIIAL